ncbi:MaoC family dehydratase [Sediminivirga luteola]|uniref:MaoC family dehydratase n=1 Tax=Sediminivirga luteola TaxID=1774748 RepID=UPI001F580F05|nr:MaoC family dehydratase [Sediminivirga luteola]MCI2265528.1 MaoC family dehydratase [Sediminivirga luteola]
MTHSSHDVRESPGSPAAQVEVGQELTSAGIPLSRADLVRYAGASGDVNPIHWNERFAREVGLDGVIAHGMLTMGQAVSVLTGWLGDPGAVLDYQTRFTKPVPVPDAESGSPEQPTQTLEVSAVAGAVDADAGTVRVDLTVTAGSAKVLGRAQALVRLAAVQEALARDGGGPAS